MTIQKKNDDETNAKNKFKTVKRDLLWRWNDEDPDEEEQQPGGRRSLTVTQFKMNKLLI